MLSEPTQIYKFLRARFKYSVSHQVTRCIEYGFWRIINHRLAFLLQPYFLYRNLTYMTRPKKCKSSRKNSVDEIAWKILNQQLDTSSPITKFKYLTINYLGFFSKESEYRLFGDQRHVRLKVFLTL